MSAVARDHSNTPAGSTTFPESLEANHPPGSWDTAYPQKKEDWMIPAVPADHPNSLAMGRMATLMFTLSMLQMTNAKLVAPTIRYRAGRPSHQVPSSRVRA
eukprot:jgi/Pico_ML_1/52327/g3047.t1